jgi:hypothetical protein
MTPRILKISAKCSDLFDAEFVVNKKRVGYEGYVIDGFGIGGGDYVELQLDIDSGKIIGFDRKKAKKLFDKVMDRGKYYSGLEDEPEPSKEEKANTKGMFYLALRTLSSKGQSDVHAIGMTLPLFVEDGVDAPPGTPELDAEGFPIRGMFEGWVEEDDEIAATRFKHPKGAPTILFDDMFPYYATAEKWLDVNATGYKMKSTRDGDVVAIWFVTAEDRQKFVDGFSEITK